jgi:lysophospholipase L1-like esterase
MSGGYRGKHVSGSSRATVIIAAAAVLLILAVVGTVALLGQREPGPGAPEQPDVSQQPDVSAGALGSISSIQQPDSSSQADPPAPLPEVEAYDFSQPAPERAAVDYSYFSDAAFVGDSRTDGFMLYSGIGAGRNLTSNGLSIFKLAEKKALTINGEKYTLLEALALEQYGKVYISLGVNELGINNDARFYDSYCQAIDAIRAVQPNAVIYIQGLIPLNEGQIEEYNGNKFKLTNEHLRVYNDLMKKAAEEKQVVYLDLYAEFVDENNELPAEASRDGVHLKKDACKQWLAYLQTHTVEFDTLYPDGPPVAEPAEPAQPDTSAADGSASE